MHLACKQHKAGFTLVELVIVISALAILSAYAVMKSVSSAEVTLPSQAQTLASDIRRAQTLAYTSGKRMRLTLPDNTRYSVACVPSATNPGDTPSCNTSQNFTVPLQKGVTVGVAPPGTTLDFTSLGQATAGATYTLTYGSNVTVTVAAETGLVTVSP
jgi:prepilin-type N-terminal cleavage/methylation domain-containing protein